MLKTWETNVKENVGVTVYTERAGALLDYPGNVELVTPADPRIGSHLRWETIADRLKMPSRCSRSFAT